MSDTNAILALLKPISSSSINIAPITQGDRVFYATVTIVLPIIQQFFIAMALNGISTKFGIFSRLYSTRVGRLRGVVALIYTFLCSLTIISYIYAYRETWDLSSSHFVLSWMVMWLYVHINFLVLDAATAFIPQSFILFFVLFYAMSNIASTIQPFELNPGFYRWGYATPAHNVVSILFQIWSGGCNNQLKRAFPVLFAWEVVGMALAVFGSLKRNKAAMMGEEDRNGEPTAA